MTCQVIHHDLKAAWIAEKAAGAPDNFEIDQATLKGGGAMNTVTFSISKPNAGWPVGSYRVDMSIAGKLEKTVKFTVAKE